ncbi:carbamoyl-phosphate synthase large subunit [Caproiciproducens galactitolivorans]|uniref:Carbamoyl phosphate synthase large chain n=1 Tax=Caproiciproducens galactitolivorans TaxID=642589 RepID=A0A4Z0YAQ4_9FIRM|nr:carbamoyl-phosphate synthase large subunit [Caproiciproducens galactitolivorans]QEY33985.1 carbamoyl-phosphate synthase large subunit [Caproiciproducens galactitolivorans]TGJ76050.1 carbamoyl-phosphate synthase large chain [Caproiciproducens galactitolivorans]
MKRKDIKKVIIIGSGPIIIGQAAEFDYAGTQACRAIREEGVEVILINSNPATIMTDKQIADKIYIEPLTVETIKKVILKENPDSILPTLGGQNALNLAVELEESGFLKENNVKMIGTNADTIRMAEDRELFKEAMERINQPCAESAIAENIEDCVRVARKIGYPVVVRPAYTLGGSGGGIADNEEQLIAIASLGLHRSRVNQVLIERCIAGWKEIEYEVMRDHNGNCITVCNMENFDPVGVHTGDSIVVAPCQTLGDKETQMLRSAALSIISELKVEGGCNVQFALNPKSFEYCVIEVNPRVSRSSALASKATGYPIAKVASKIALGYTLDEIRNAITKKTYACFEPTLDYCVVKIPRWPFDKFVYAKRSLGTQMKATGEVMGIAPSFEAALMKSIRSLEQNVFSLMDENLQSLSNSELEERLHVVDDRRLWVVSEALRRGISPDKIHEITKIDLWFLDKLLSIIQVEKACATQPIDRDLLLKAKTFGFLDKTIAELSGKTVEEIRALQEKWDIRPVYKMVDTCAAEFEAETPYYYSTYGIENESCAKSDRKKILVIGSGPIRIGQGIEFDYCSVHSVWALRNMGCETIIVNNNPETVSTDFDIADKLYFEPLTEEDILHIVQLEKPDGAVVQFGGQTAIKLAGAIEKMGVPILGTSFDSIDEAEDRERFDAILNECNIPRAEGRMVYTCDEAIKAANELGYPVLVRPSYVLGGQGMHIAYSDEDIIEQIGIINRIEQEHPILIDKYIMGTEVEVDAVCDGTDSVIPGIMQHIERAGIHSGDSISVYPAIGVAKDMQELVVEYTRRLAKALKVKGLLNIQFIVKDNEVYVIEANPRSSRTVPYISKVTGIPIVPLAVGTFFGKTLPEMGYNYGLQKERDLIAIKMPVFSFEKLYGADVNLGPEMKSTGEVLGVARTFDEALIKSFYGAGVHLIKKGRVIFTVKDTDKKEALPIAKGLYNLGWTIYATPGTSDFFNDNDIPTIRTNKIGTGAPDILDHITSGKIDLVINTPSKGVAHNRDGYKIRRNAVECGIPCLTSLDTANAFLTCARHVDTTHLSVVDITKVSTFLNFI